MIEASSAVEEKISYLARIREKKVISHFVLYIYVVEACSTWSTLDVNNKHAEPECQMSMSQSHLTAACLCVCVSSWFKLQSEMMQKVQILI